MVVAVVTSACGSDPGSADLGELRALWMLDADRDTQSVNVAGRVIEASEVNIAAGFNFATYNDLFDPPPANVGLGEIPILYPGFYGVRLTGGDVMHVTTGNNRLQLYRQEADFVYRSNYALDENNTTAELSLRYVGNRFPTSIASARIFDVGNLMMSNAGNANAVSFTWNRGDALVPEGYVLSQHMSVTLRSCTDVNIDQETVVLDIPIDDRETTISANALPTGFDPIDSTPVNNTTGPCQYSFQIITKLEPNALTLNPEIDPTSPEAEDVTPLVIVLNRTASVQLEIVNGGVAP